MPYTLYYFNPWAVVAAVMVNMVIGALWYSPLLFGNRWLKAIGKRPEDISQEDASKSMALSIVPATVSALLLALACGMLNIQTAAGALLTALMISVGFIGMNAFNLVLFEGRSMVVTVINTGYTWVSFSVGAIIIALWR